MKTKTCELVFILDRSSSMGGLESDTIGGFNAMLETQKAKGSHCLITTVLFDHKIEFLHDRTDINAVKPLTTQEYWVRGTTALLDAIGCTIQKIKNAQLKMQGEFFTDKVIFIIITDGMENASCKYSLDAVKFLIERQKSEFNWEFIFLGANIDAVGTAAGIGIRDDRAADFIADGAGINLSFKVMCDAVSEYRESGQISTYHLDKIRDDEKTRGQKGR